VGLRRQTVDFGFGFRALVQDTAPKESALSRFLFSDHAVEDLESLWKHGLFSRDCLGEKRSIHTEGSPCFTDDALSCLTGDRLSRLTGDREAGTEMRPIRNTCRNVFIIQNICMISSLVASPAPDYKLCKAPLSHRHTVKVLTLHRAPGFGLQDIAKTILLIRYYAVTISRIN